MTVPYSSDVPRRFSSLGWCRIVLCRWTGSIYKLVLRELLLPDVSCRGAVTRSVKRMSVPRVLHMLWCHLPNIFNLCNCFNSSTSLNRRSRSSCFLRFQRDLCTQMVCKGRISYSLTCPPPLFASPFLSWKVRPRQCTQPPFSANHGRILILSNTFHGILTQLLTRYHCTRRMPLPIFPLKPSSLLYCTPAYKVQPSI